MTRTQRLTRNRLPKIINRSEGGRRTMTGYAAVFYREGDPTTEYEIWSDMVERISPTAFNRALAEKQDVRALFDAIQLCCSDGVVGNSAAIDGDIGLRYEIDLPDTSTGNDVAASM